MQIFSPYSKKPEFEPKNSAVSTERVPYSVSATRYFELMDISQSIAQDFFSRLPGAQIFKSPDNKTDFLLNIDEYVIPVKFSAKGIQEKTRVDLKDLGLPQGAIIIRGDFEEFRNAYQKSLNGGSVENQADNLSDKEKASLLNQTLSQLPRGAYEKLMDLCEVKNFKKPGKKFKFSLKKSS